MKPKLAIELVSYRDTYDATAKAVGGIVTEKVAALFWVHVYIATLRAIRAALLAAEEEGRS